METGQQAAKHSWALRADQGGRGPAECQSGAAGEKQGDTAASTAVFCKKICRGRFTNLFI